MRYGIPGQGGGQDGLLEGDVHNMTRDAIEYCRSGQGSLFLEVKTYRYRGHSKSDPQKYRTKEEVAKFQEQDPIGRLEKVLREKKILDTAKLDAMNNEIHELVEKAHVEADGGGVSDDRGYLEGCLRESFPHNRAVRIFNHQAHQDTKASKFCLLAFLGDFGVLVVQLNFH